MPRRLDPESAEYLAFVDYALRKQRERPSRRLDVPRWKVSPTAIKGYTPTYRRPRNQFSPQVKDVLGSGFQRKGILEKVVRYKGKFDQAQNLLLEVHQDATIHLRGHMADVLEERIAQTGRPQRPGNRLANALLSNNNAEWSVYGFKAGIEDWLDESPAALYWERLEFGEINRPGGMFGREVVGRWSGVKGRAIDGEAPTSFTRTRYMDKTEYGYRRDLKFVWRPATAEDRMLGRSFTISRHIPEYRYIRGGIDRFKRKSDGSRTYTQYLLDEYRRAFARYGIELERDKKGGPLTRIGGRAG